MVEIQVFDGDSISEEERQVQAWNEVLDAVHSEMFAANRFRVQAPTSVADQFKILDGVDLDKELQKDMMKTLGVPPEMLKP